MYNLLQVGKDVELRIAEGLNDIVGPSCSCLAAVDAYLVPRNGCVGRFNREYRAPMPSVFVRRLDPNGPAPPFVLPRFCPFCGEAYGASK